MIKALLWDMDGLLVDTEPLWTIAENAVCEARGGRFTAQMKAAMVGHRLDSAIEILVSALADQGCEVDAEEIAEDLQLRMVELFKGDIVFCDGALELLQRAHDDSLPCALVSSSYRMLVDAVIARLPPDMFEISIAGDEVIHAKPHPEPYLSAAEKLGFGPQECLVLEDSPTGMRSALAAGCQAIMVPSVAGVTVQPEWRMARTLADVAL